MRSVVVTGVSSGIGWGATKVLIEHGLHVFGSVRKAEDAERLANEFGPAFTPLIFDITDQLAVSAAVEHVREYLNGATLFGLVNNAGISVPGPLMHQPVAQFRLQLEVNLVGSLIVTQAFLPLLGVDRALAGQPGRIINISSVGGRIASPFIGAYAASKHGLEGMSESLRRELMPFGIDVIIIRPGAVRTAIWGAGEAAAGDRYDQTEYAQPIKKFRTFVKGVEEQGLPPERLGKTIVQALTTPRPRVCYNVVPRSLINWTIPRLLPRRRLDRIIAGRLGLSRS